MAAPAQPEERQRLAPARVDGGARAPRERDEGEHVALEEGEDEAAGGRAAPAQHQDRQEAERHAEADAGEERAVVPLPVPGERVEGEPDRLAARDAGARG